MSLTDHLIIMGVNSADEPLMSTCPQLLDINVNFPLGYSLKFAYLCVFIYIHGLPRCLRGKESACQRRRCKGHRFDPQVGKIP